MKPPKPVMITGGFLMLPHALLKNPKFAALSSSAVKLLLDIAAQFNGKNNGDLSAAWKTMKPKGWKSETTLGKAKAELLEAGFIAETRKGRLPNVCGLYGVTWFEINSNPKLDLGPEGFPYGAWAELPKEPRNIKSLAPVDGVANRSIAPVSGVIYPSVAPETGAIRRTNGYLTTPETGVLYRCKHLQVDIATRRES